MNSCGLKREHYLKYKPKESKLICNEENRKTLLPLWCQYKRLHMLNKHWPWPLGIKNAFNGSLSRLKICAHFLVSTVCTRSGAFTRLISNGYSYTSLCFYCASYFKANMNGGNCKMSVIGWMCRIWVAVSAGWVGKMNLALPLSKADYSSEELDV